MTRFSFAILLAILLSQIAVAQNNSIAKSWTLQQCVDYALQNNIQVKQQELNAELSQITLIQSKAQVLPNLNGSISHNYNFGRTINPVTNDFLSQQILSQNYSISSNMNLFNGLQTYNNIKQNQYNVMASKYDVDKIENDIALSVASAYLQIMYSEEALSNANFQLKLSLEQVSRTEKIVEVGGLARGSLLDIQSQYASEELALANARNQLDIAYLNLIQILNLDSVENFRIDRPVITIPSEDPILIPSSQIYAVAIKSQPEIKSAELKVKANEHGIKLAKGAISPSLTLGAALGTIYSDAALRLVGTPLFTGYSPNGDVTDGGDVILSPVYSINTEKTPYKEQLEDNFSQTLGFRLSIPLFNNLQTKTSIDRAKISFLNAKYELDYTQDQLRQTIQQAHADAVASLKKYNASQKAVDATKEAYKYAEEKFNVGAISSFDYSEMKNRLTRAESDLLQAKYDYIFTTKVLDFYMGKPFTF